MATAHLICGSTGAGKTTYAIHLAEGTSTIRFTIDEWMAGLFFPDMPEPLTHAWALERVVRCERRILSLCGQIAATSADIILDFGFFSREQRDRVRQAVGGLGMDVLLHYLHVPADIRWRRVCRRNAHKGETYELEVTRGMFDFCENLFEEPDSRELEGAVVVR